MMQSDPKERKPFGQSSPDIVLLQHLDHIRAGQPGDESGRKGGQGKSRQYPMGQRFQTGHRQEMEFHAEDKLEKARKNEIGDGNADRRDDHRGGIMPPVPFHGGDGPEENPAGDGDA